VSEAASKPKTEPKRTLFAGVDLREAGRRGGIASGLARRNREIRRLEEKIAQSSNGAAQLGLLRMRQARERELQERIFAADKTLVSILDEIAREQGNLERLRERRREFVAEGDVEIGELQSTIAELEAKLAGAQHRHEHVDEDSLAVILLGAGEEMTERGLVRIGFLEPEPEAEPA
jgi:hypothetical protein